MQPKSWSWLLEAPSTGGFRSCRAIITSAAVVVSGRRPSEVVTQLSGEEAQLSREEAQLVREAAQSRKDG
jgi:hypothetical protein